MVIRAMCPFGGTWVRWKSNGCRSMNIYWRPERVPRDFFGSVSSPSKYSLYSFISHQITTSHVHSPLNPERHIIESNSYQKCGTPQGCLSFIFLVCDSRYPSSMGKQSNLYFCGWHCIVAGSGHYPFHLLHNGSGSERIDPSMRK